MSKHITARWGNQALDFTGVSDTGAKVALGSADVPETFRPSELVLVSLASCTGMDAISIMSKKRLAVESYEVEATGTQREDHPRFFTHIVVEHVVRGSSIDDGAVARAIELSARKYCVVGANLASGDTAINHRMRIIDEAGERTCDCLTIGPKGAGLSHYEER
jgi:putative redox protein